MKNATMVLMLVVDALLEARWRRTQSDWAWVRLGIAANRRIGEHRRTWAAMLAR